VVVVATVVVVVATVVVTAAAGAEVGPPYGGSYICWVLHMVGPT
jgi:hypothetical protein